MFRSEVRGFILLNFGSGKDIILNITAVMLLDKFKPKVRFQKLDFDNPTSSIVCGIIIFSLLPPKMSHIIIQASFVLADLRKAL